MPQLGSDMQAGVLVAWSRKPGDVLQRGDVIAEVETDKGVIEVEVFAPGVIERFLVEPGTTVTVGTPLAVLADLSQQPSPPPMAAVAVQQPGNAPVEVSAPLEQPVIASRATQPAIAAPPSVRRRAHELGIDLSLAFGQTHRLRLEDLPPSGVGPTAAHAPRSSPAARKLARELQLDLQRITGTGPDGAVVLADVQRAQAAQRATPPPPAAKSQDDAASSQTGLRRAIAQAMARSKREIPHYYLSTSIDLAAALAWLKGYNDTHSVTERILPGALLLKASALAARQYPQFNCLWQDGPHSAPDVHLGVAIALRGGGLVAPAIHRADTLALPELMQKLQDLVTRARAGGLRSSELSDGTISVTSLGERGVESVLPIIYAPQTAIIGFGRIAERPWVVASQLAVRPVVTASLAADHRVTDGHLGARFLSAIDELLQHPESL